MAMFSQQLPVSHKNLIKLCCLTSPLFEQGGTSFTHVDPYHFYVHLIVSQDFCPDREVELRCLVILHFFFFFFSPSDQVRSFQLFY